MPIYEYACGSCGKLNEVIQKVNDPAPEKCDGCAAPGTLSKVVSRTSFMLKGGGWYSDLYASSGGKKSGGSSGSSGGSSSGGSGGSTPPASSSSGSTGSGASAA
jgi:putative FmdB family regulatory protein